MQTLQQFCLRWNNHQPNFISVFTNLLNHEALVDVTIACEGKHLQAHKVVLSACSSYFQTLFTINPCQHPIVILKDIKFSDLKTMVDFMYYGEVNVSQDQLPAILKIAEMLKIKGLADSREQNSMIKSYSTSSDKADLLTPGDSNWGSTDQRSPSPMSPAARRKRLRKSSTGSGSGSTERTSEELISDGGPQVKIEAVSDSRRSASRQSLRNSNQEPSTDSETKEGSQDSGAEDQVSRLSVDSRQPSHERQTYPDKRQLSSESRQHSYENRQLSSESRQGSFEIRQLSQNNQLSIESRQASHESRLSHESSLESNTADDIIDSNLSPAPGQTKVGTKRGRLLMRQSRIKKELDTHTSPDSEPGSPGFSSTHLTVPPTRIERQRSEPIPSSHSPPLSTLTTSSSLNLLTVPQPAFLVKQHSFPLLSSTSAPAATTTTTTNTSSQTMLVQRQLSVGATHTSQLKTVASLHPLDVDARSASPIVNTDQLPIVRIISDEPVTKTNSGFRPKLEETKRSQSSDVRQPSDTNRSVHCPALRSGPALGCNFCWNTIDGHGRILRRKTKYHCPECQTNLCIVPCFQEYHQRQSPSPIVKTETSNPS